jgi:hypothetical protein
LLFAHATHSEIWKVGNNQSAHKLSQKFVFLWLCANPHWTCIFNHFPPSSQVQMEQKNIINLVCMFSIYTRILPWMKHDSLVKLSKNVKIWRLPITNNLAHSMMGISHSLTKFPFFSTKRFNLKFLTIILS